MNKKQAVRQCRRKYGKRLTRVSFRKNRYVCHYRASRKQTIRSCRKKYGKRFIKLIKKNNHYYCRYQASAGAALENCLKTYGDRFIDMSKKGEDFLCHYYKSQAQMRQYCRRIYGPQFAGIKSHGGGYACVDPKDASGAARNNQGGANANKDFKTPYDEFLQKPQNEPFPFEAESDENHQGPVHPPSSLNHGPQKIDI